MLVILLTTVAIISINGNLNIFYSYLFYFCTCLILNLGQPNNFCKKNEEVKCRNPCTNSCQYGVGGTFCPLSCRIGCWCKDGYYKDSRGNCVPVNECRPGIFLSKLLNLFS